MDTNTILSVSSFIISVISVCTAIATIKQNNKMIEESTRPNISVYIETTYFQELQLFLIIKNFGASTGVITDFTYDFDIDKIRFDERSIPFEHIIGTSFCPNQSMRIPVSRKSLINHTLGTLDFLITYKSANKSYKEQITINLKAYTDFPFNRATTNEYHSDPVAHTLKTISYTLQDMGEKKL